MSAATATGPISQAPKSHHEDSQSPAKKCNWKGRQVSAVSGFFRELGKGLASGVKKTLRVLGKLSMDATSLARLCRLGVTAFAVVEKGLGAPGIFTAASNKLATTESTVYTIGVGDQVKYFGKGEQKKESLACSLGQGALLAAGIGGVFVLLGEVALLNFAKIGQAIGKLPVFGAVSKMGVSLGQVVSGIAAGGFVCLAVDSAMKLAKAKTTQEKVQHTLNLAWMISEVALAVFCAAGAASVAGFAVLATVSAGLGIASFVYSMHTDDKEAAEKAAQEAADQAKEKQQLLGAAAG